ncbi:AMP-binding protein [Chamaesiphon sp. OTE_20_metabat_361]|uniref:AMP-binding protein n=1 Tax=Chamaesiphon sp. OTE_20_metabat_361 TaxID=2964689 RepID=UPI00286B5B0A|nr:AMP-binding protein [Chamaesiphon sp. OTE_20_metabat_361]
MFNLPKSGATGEWIYDRCCQRLDDGWLVGTDGKAVIDRAEQILAACTIERPHFTSIATSDPLEFIAMLMAGCKLNLPIFLANPGWGTFEREQVSKLTTLDLTQHQQLIMIPTGGSSGIIKFATHSWETLSATVRGFQEFYELEHINTVCTLPLYHVSGLMQLCRSLLTGGKLAIVDFHELCANPVILTKQLELEHYFISLVPTQLAKLLALNSAWLARFDTILLGGAPPSSELLNSARIARLPIALTYGMTETGSQVTSLKPAEFLAGNRSCGKALPHAKIGIKSDSKLTNNTPQSDRVGSIQIQATSLMFGYFPDLDRQFEFESDDIGTIDKDGYLTIVDRNSSKIISGGENIYPIEVVEVIMATGLVADVWVVGLSDCYWGQAVTAVYVARELPVSAAILSAAIAGKISKYKLPKYWVSVDRIPRNSLGKVLTNEVENLARAAR